MQSAVFSDILLPFVLVVVMFGMGITLEKKDFQELFLKPRSIVTGLIAQMVLLPLVAFILVFFLDIPPVIKVGFILIAACPGGTASNLVAFLLRGNVALCVTLTAITSLLILITLPLIVNLGLIVFLGHAEDISLPLDRTVLNIFLYTLLPVGAGLLLREKYPVIAIKMQKPMEYIMTILLFAAFLAILIFEESQETSFLRKYGYVLPVALALNFFSMLVGYLFARAMSLRHKDNFTISIQVGLQNSALAIYVAGSLIGSSEMAVVSVIYSAFTFFSTALFGYLAKRFG